MTVGARFYPSGGYSCIVCYRSWGTDKLHETYPEFCPTCSPDVDELFPAGTVWGYYNTRHAGVTTVIVHGVLGLNPFQQLVSDVLDGEI